jgi:hypothetical protein
MAKKNSSVAKIFEPNKKKIITAFIATPALHGNVEAHYVASITEACKLGIKNNIDIMFGSISNESILPMARNQLLTIALDLKVDCLVFIDADVSCDPKTLINIIKNPEDVIAVPTVKKNDKEEQYDFWFEDEEQFETIKNNLQSVKTVSTSCLKLSKKVLEKLAENSVSLNFRGKKLKNICQYDFEGEEFIGEDVYLCNKINKLGFKIWIDFSSTCMHVGSKIYEGNYKKTILKQNDN